MGIINTGLQSIAMERAKETAKIGKIHSEVTENAIDEIVNTVADEVMQESFDDMDIAELDALLHELPDDATAEKEEIARMLTNDDDDIDIDDIVGIVDDALV